MAAILSPVVLGLVGLGVDVGMWEKSHKLMQEASDASAVSAAVAYLKGSVPSPVTQGQSIAGSFGFVNGANGAVVTVNQPPASGNYKANPYAVEVIITQPQPALFSAVLGQGPVTVAARSVAIASAASSCILALDRTASVGIGVQGSPSVAANNCSVWSDSNTATSVDVGGSATLSASGVGAMGGVYGQSSISTTSGIVTNGSYIADPYSLVNFPSYSGCDKNNYSTNKSVTINPGVYCNGITLKAGASVTMTPGVYYVDRGALDLAGQASLSGTGVTIVFTSSTGSNYATAKITGGATVNLTAPTTGPLAGIVLYSDRSAPVGTSYALAGGMTQVLTGTVYLPKGAVNYAGGATGNTCSQIIGDTISFVGNSSFAMQCANTGVKLIGATAQIVE